MKLLVVLALIPLVIVVAVGALSGVGASPTSFEPVEMKLESRWPLGPTRAVAIVDA